MSRRDDDRGHRGHLSADDSRSPSATRLGRSWSVALGGTLAITLMLIRHADAAQSPAPVPPSKAPAALPVRYRPIGCLRRGPVAAYSHGPRRKEVALSFDDGPFPLT